MTELDPDDPSVGFGLADLGFGSPELGSFSLEELQSFEGPFGLGIERDIWFEGRSPISVFWTIVPVAAARRWRLRLAGPETSRHTIRMFRAWTTFRFAPSGPELR